MRLLLTWALFSICAPANAAGAAWYVDFDHGNDKASGRSPATPLRHAPGDANALANAASARLVAGDSVFFKGGVTYRGTIKAVGSDDPANPIRYVGDEWPAGAAKAIISGADPVRQLDACPAASACYNHPSWQKLMIIRYATGATLVKFYTADAMLYVSQYPQPADPFFADETNGYLSVAASAIPAFKAGKITSAASVAALGTPTSDTQVAFWASPNEVYERPATVSGSTIRFPTTGLTMYDKQGLYSLVNAPALINGPGQYATIPGGTALAWITRQPLFVGTKRSGFELARVSNVIIKGFAFRNFTANEGDNGIGAAIISRAGPLANIVVTGNDFVDMAMHNKAGPIQLSSVNGLTITGNHFENLERGSGVRLSAIMDAEISDNAIRNIGRTGIAFFGNASGNLRITNNLITGLFGTHGNGISIYRDNRNVLVANNTVVNSAFPLTIEGNFDSATPNNLTVARNIFQSVGDKQYATVSWGKNFNGLLYTGNVVMAAGSAMIVNFGDTNVNISNNVLSTSGFTYELARQVPPAAWIVRKNLVGIIRPTAIIADPARLTDPAFGNTKPVLTPLPAAICATIAPTLDATRQVGSTHICL